MYLNTLRSYILLHAITYSYAMLFDVVAWQRLIWKVIASEIFVFVSSNTCMACSYHDIGKITYDLGVRLMSDAHVSKISIAFQ